MSCHAFAYAFGCTMPQHYATPRHEHTHSYHASILIGVQLDGLATATSSYSVGTGNGGQLRRRKGGQLNSALDTAKKSFDALSGLPDALPEHHTRTAGTSSPPRTLARSSATIAPIFPAKSDARTQRLCVKPRTPVNDNQCARCVCWFGEC